MGYDCNLTRRFKSFGCITLTSFCLLLAPCAFGQVDEGSVTGVVQDASGAVVPGAKVCPNECSEKEPRRRYEIRQLAYKSGHSAFSVIRN